MNKRRIYCVTCCGSEKLNMDEILKCTKCEDDDFYKVIGCDESSSIEQILTEYKALSLCCHPDKNAGDVNAVQKFQKIQKAKEVLTNPETRAVYDKWRNSGISVPFSKFQNLSKESHTSIHWATKKQKDLMLESCCSSDDECCNRSSGPCEIKSPFRATWISDPAGETLQRFRNYEI